MPNALNLEKDAQQDGVSTSGFLHLDLVVMCICFQLFDAGIREFVLVWVCFSKCFERRHGVNQFFAVRGRLCFVLV